MPRCACPYCSVDRVLAAPPFPQRTWLAEGGAYLSWFMGLGEDGAPLFRVPSPGGWLTADSIERAVALMPGARAQGGDPCRATFVKIAAGRDVPLARLQDIVASEQLSGVARTLWRADAPPVSVEHLPTEAACHVAGTAMMAVAPLAAPEAAAEPRHQASKRQRRAAAHPAPRAPPRTRSSASRDEAAGPATRERTPPPSPPSTNEREERAARGAQRSRAYELHEALSGVQEELRPEVDDVIASRGAWDAELVLYLLERNATPRLHHWDQILDRGARCEVQCTFLSPDGACVPDVWVALSLLALLYPRDACDVVRRRGRVS